MQLALLASVNMPTQFDGYQLLRKSIPSHRSILYLAHEIDRQQLLVIKVPASEVTA